MEKPKGTYLQLRWELDESGHGNRMSWLCHYELVLPLQEYDIRRELYDEDGERTGTLHELVVAIKGPTVRTGASTPCYLKDGALYFDPPYRDGVHAKWDAKLLGNLPIYCVSHTGEYVHDVDVAA